MCLKRDHLLLCATWMKGQLWNEFSWVCVQRQSKHLPCLCDSSNYCRCFQDYIFPRCHINKDRQVERLPRWKWYQAHHCLLVIAQTCLSKKTKRTHRHVCCPHSMRQGRENQCVNTTKPGWWPPRGMTRWKILSAWPLIPVLEADPLGRREKTEARRWRQEMAKSIEGGKQWWEENETGKTKV